MKLKNFADAEEFLNQFIPQSNQQLYAAGFGLERAKEFLKLLGNPQNNLKIIHIAGTSGKGSTAYLTSLALKSQGFKTGLFLSPHITTVRERIQINDENISEEQFVKWVNFFLPFIDTMKRTEFGAPSWFEIITAIAFCEFYTKKVDYTVIETGLGGLFDSTNTIENKNKLVLLTKIGLDHMHVLGNTIEKIAEQKTGIIHKENTVISIYQKESVQQVIEKKAKKEHANLFFIERKDIQNISLDSDKTIFDLKTHTVELKTVHLGLLGTYQTENAALAISALYYVSDRENFPVDYENLRQAYENAYFPGRFEIKNYKNQTLILDGAHNPQKMKEFIESLQQIYPHQKFLFLLAFKKGKDYQDMLKYIEPIAKKIILTEFTSNQEFAPVAENTKKLANILQNNGMKNYEEIPDLKDALEEAAKENKLIIATGSLYFLSELYKVLN